MGDSYEKLNDWSDSAVRASLRTRASGKQRVTIDVKSEALGIPTDPAYWVLDVAEAIAKAFRDAITAIGTPVSPASEDRGKVAANAYRKGKAWARERYAGGRMGGMPPKEGGRSLLNDSGRLVKSIIARFIREGDQAGMAVINVAANRLGPEPIVRNKTLEIMAEHIPFVRNIAELGKVPVVAAAVEKTAKGAVRKLEDVRLEVVKAAVRAAQSAGRLIEEAAGDEGEG